MSTCSEIDMVVEVMDPSNERLKANSSVELIERTVESNKMNIERDCRYQRS